MVTCDKDDLAEDENPTYIEHPKLVIEVLSPSTEKDDRGEKFFKYTYCPSIQEYVLINYECMLVQTERRKGMQWLTTWFKQGENVELQNRRDLRESYPTSTRVLSGSFLFIIGKSGPY
jgi:Uma2 family endonuclease